MEKELPKRKHPRINEYDYGGTGVYFVTICTENRKCLLSKIVGRGLAPAEIVYSEYGAVAEKQLFLLEERFPSLKIDQYVIMPNHIHILVGINEEAAGASPRPTLMDMMCAFKSLTTRECKKIKPIEKLFQTSFYEHIVRNRRDYEEIAKYIHENPEKWFYDELYSEEV